MAQAQYNMRAWNTDLGQYVFWTVEGAPDDDGSESGYDPADLEDIVVASVIQGTPATLGATLDTGNETEGANLVVTAGDAVVYKEAAAPSTAAGEGVFYAGTDHKPYFRPQSDGSPIDLTAGSGGGGIDYGTRVGHVNPTSTDAADDSDTSTPFLTIQKAIDEIGALSGGGTVLVYPKGSDYDENVVINVSDIALVAISAEPSGSPIRIKPTKGPAIIVTESAATPLLDFITDQANESTWDTQAYDTPGGDYEIDDSAADVDSISITGFMLESSAPTSWPAVAVFGSGADSTLLTSNGLRTRQSIWSTMAAFPSRTRM
jgi:hypothetical protein